MSDVADDARSIASIESVTAGVGGGAGGRRPLIHIWVPSVFMSGTGQNTHHVYQVYLRIREEEWNIYRRYSEFYAFHQVGYPRTTSSVSSIAIDQGISIEIYPIILEFSFKVVSQFREI